MATAIVLMGMLPHSPGPASSPSPRSGGATAATAPAYAAPSATVNPTGTSTSEAGASSAAVPPAPARATGPAAVVRDYFAAISRQDYVTAWNLGGDNLNPSGYQHFVDGLSTTVADTAIVTGVNGDQVYIKLDALQSDNTHQYVSGYYVVTGNQITSANMH